MSETSRPGAYVRVQLSFPKSSTFAASPRTLQNHLVTADTLDALEAKLERAREVVRTSRARTRMHLVGPRYVLDPATNELPSS